MILLARFAPHIIGLLIIAGLWWRYTWAINKAEELETQAALLQQNIQGQEAAREALHNQYLKADEATQKATATIAQLRRKTHSEVTRIDEASKHEPTWADTPLPDSIVAILRSAADPSSTGNSAD